MKVAIRGFLGEIPRLEVHRLPDLNASAARTVKNFRGNAEPFRAPESITTLAKLGTKLAIYRFGQDLDSDTQHWFHWLNDTDVERGFVTGNDADERTYFIEAGQPMRMTDGPLATTGAAQPVSSLLVGLPAPTAAPTVTLTDPTFTFHSTDDVDETNDVITKASHGLTTGDQITYSREGGAANIGLSDGAVYYVRAVTAGSFSLHLLADDAIDNINKVNLSKAGAETHRITRGASGIATQLLVAYTYVNSWGHEGPESLVSTSTNYYFGQSLTVANMQTGPVAAGYDVTLKRIYVAQADATGRAVLRFWKEVALNVESTSDVLDFTLLGSAIQDPRPTAPPSGLIGLKAHPNGFLMAIRPSDRRLYRSEVFKPYAWPFEYSDPLDAVPVAIEVMGQSVVIGTKGPTYMATGNDPLRLIPARLEGQQPCVSKRSMRLTNYGVVYASPNGLVAVTPGGRMDLVTRDLFTQDQWQAFNPASMVGVVHDERYFCFWRVNDSNRGLLIFDFSGEGLGVIQSDQWASAAYDDPRRDALFLCQPPSYNLTKWDGNSGSFLTMRWRSKTFTLERPQNLGAAKLIGDFAGRTCTFRIFGDGVLRHAETVTNSIAFQLPRNYRARDYQFEVEGTAIVRELIVAGTMGEIGT